MLVMIILVIMITTITNNDEGDGAYGIMGNVVCITHTCSSLGYSIIWWPFGQ